MNNLQTVDLTPYSESVSALLLPISTDSPAGEDLSYSVLFDDIREARRADDPGLAQGDWQTNVKTADWHRVRALCETALKERTKDLQIAAWYTEALIHLDGFDGLSIGLELMNGLLANYWLVCFPIFDDNDASERAAKIEWLNTHLPFAIKYIAMTSGASGGYTSLQWEESRWVENIGLKDPKTKTDAIADGKLSGELFDKAIKQSGREFYEPLLATTKTALAAVNALTQQVDALFRLETPSLLDLRQVIEGCANLAERLLAEVAGGRPTSSNPQNAPTESINNAGDIGSGTAIKTVGALHNRSDAIRSLRDVAFYFRVNEPQSPVALLAERAARWAEMSMDEWLSAVIKDEGTLGQLRELLDIPRST